MRVRYGIRGGAVGILAVFLLFLLIGPAGAQENGGGTVQVTLEECIEKGLSSSPLIDQAEAGVVKQRAQLEVTGRNRWPSLELTGGLSYLSEVEGEFVIPPAPPISLTSGGGESVSLEVSAVQPLFTGFEIESGIDIGRQLLRQARLEQEHSVREVQYRIEQAYWNLVYAVESVKVVYKSVEQSESLLQQVDSLFNQGMATREEVLRMEMNLEQALLRKLESEHALQLAMMQLNQLTGYEADQVTVPSCDFDGSAAGSVGLEYEVILAEALARRSELQMLEIQMGIQEIERRKAVAGWLPNISLQGQVQYAKPNPRQFPPEDQFVLSWQIGVMGSINFSELKTTGPELSRIEGTRREIESRRESLIQNISLRIKQDLLDIEKSRQSLEASETILAQAGENYDIVYDKFRSGSAVDSDLITAQQQLLEAQLRRTRALTAQRQALSRLRYDVGDGGVR